MMFVAKMWWKFSEVEISFLDGFIRKNSEIFVMSIRQTDRLTVVPGPRHSSSG
jgi:hypothetical protein